MAAKGYRMKTVTGKDGRQYKIPVKIKGKGKGSKPKKKAASKSTGRGSLEARVSRVEKTQAQTIRVLGAVVTKVAEHDRKINALAGLARGMSPRQLRG